MTYEEQIIISTIVDRELGPIVREDRALHLARQADAEVERLSGEVERFKKLSEEYCKDEIEANRIVGKLEAELAKIKSAAGTEDPIALIEAGKKLPTDKDGMRVVPGDVLVCPNGHRITSVKQHHLACTGDECYALDPGNHHSIRYQFSELQLAREAKEKGDVERK